VVRIFGTRSVHEKFDADGRLVHQATRDFLATFLQRFADLTARFTS
jgi:hypothetical protein